jgi:6-phosphofructokinase 1
MLTQDDLHVRSLGERKVRSPLALSSVPNDDIADYVRDDARVALDVETCVGQPWAPLLLEKAGPRELIHFDPAYTRAAIVTCGGLCPGINNVIRSMVFELHHKYRVKDILGVRYGYEGLTGAPGYDPIRLGPDEVRSVHKHGGSFLGLSRGAQDPALMVDTLARFGVNLLFAVGGDGTLKGAHAIAQEALRRGAPIAVVGVPKTIDNDVPLVDKTFGFETAVEVARLAIDAAHTEAYDARNGVAVVKLMGRDAGFIAAHATIASAEVNFCLIPEARFDLEGDAGLLAALEARLRARGHALIVVAEGCIAHWGSAAERERDASGNPRYSGAHDVGPLLRDTIASYLKSRGLPSSVKYIDPSYMIRSVPANANDSILCDNLARHAVHAGMAGKTDMMIGRWHRVFTHVPLAAVTSQKKRVDTDSDLWLSVTETTGQPLLQNDPRAPSGHRRPIR